jgi:IS30 family transposase
MRKAGYTQSAIASCFGCSGSTISREVRHNLGRRGYRHKQADEMANRRIFESRKRRKFTLRLKWQLRVTCERQAKRRGNDSNDLRVWAVYR